MILTPSLQCGGSEKFVSLVSNHINNNKFSVCLLVVNNARPFYEIRNPAIAITDLKKERVLFSLPAIKKVVKIFKPDIIFSTANHLNLYLAIFRGQFDSKIKFIAREASIVSINIKQAKIPSFYGRLIKKYYNRFDRIICQSVYMQQDLVKYWSVPLNKTIVIYNAVQLPALTKTSEKKEAINTYKFITVARLSKEKGIERLIHAVGLLTLDFKYYIIGEGSKRNELQKLINELQLQDKVFLTGQKEDPFNSMEDADLLLIGSYYEGFPNVLLEAGAYGIPVVAFNAPGGLAEIITETENGLLVEDNDPVAFAAAINKAIKTDFIKDQITGTTKERFSINRMMLALEDIFLKLTPDK